MKKEIFLSFKPDYFKPLLYGMKKYEYRKRFCKEPVTAYLYLSSPVQKIVGIIEFGKPIEIEKLVEDYDEESVVYKRLMSKIECRDKYAIPIESLKLFKEPVGIKEIKEIVPSFFIPQSYLYISKYEKLYKHLQNKDLYNEEFSHSHKNVYEDNIGVTCKEVETFEDFKQKDKEYDNIKTPYLTRRKNEYRNKKSWE